MDSHVLHHCVFDGMSDWETGYATAWINNPQFQKRPGRYRVRTVGVHKKTITTMGGLCIQPDLAIQDLCVQESAMLILPGGAAWDEGQNSEIIQTAARFLDSGNPVAAICGATAGLARAGLLDNRRHTSNDRGYLNMTFYKGTRLYEEAPAVTDNNLITASGMAPVDFAVHIFRHLDIYTPSVLKAWSGLFKTGRADYFVQLMTAANINRPETE